MREEEKSHWSENLCTAFEFLVEIFCFEVWLIHSLLVIHYHPSFTAQFKPLFLLDQSTYSIAPVLAHSLLGTQQRSAIKRTLQQELAVSDMYEYGYENWGDTESHRN
jgi:hypothetical protein